MSRKSNSPSIAAIYGRKQDRYLELICRFPLRPIRTDTELADAIAIVDSLIDQDERTSPEQDYLDVLSDLIEVYEDASLPIPPINDAELLRLLIAGKAVTQSQVATETGIAESTVSAVLSGKRKLTRDQIGKLARYFRVDPSAFPFSG